jgi:hypothetical protein
MVIQLHKQFPWASPKAKNPECASTQGFSALRGGPEGSRTPNLLIRSEMLYPVELQNRLTECKFSQIP